MRRLLKTAEFIAGASARHRVFEPLIADWQRELQQALTPLERCLAIVAGSFGFLRALAVCAVIDGAWIPPLRTTLKTTAAIVVALGISIGVLLLAPIPQNIPRDLSEPFMQRWILVWATVLVPPVFILGAFLLRRDARVTLRHAVLFTLLAAAAMTTLAANTTDEALRKRFDTFENQERMRELALARHRAGRFVFTGDGYHRESTSTLEERRANFEKYRARMAAYRQAHPAAWRDQVAQASPVLLAVIFAVMGWTLAGLRRPTMLRAFGWWALVFTLTIVSTRVFWLVVQVPMPRTPQWLMPALFVSVACTLAAHSLRSNNSMRSS